MAGPRARRHVTPARGPRLGRAEGGEAEDGAREQGSRRPLSRRPLSSRVQGGLSRVVPPLRVAPILSPPICCNPPQSGPPPVPTHELHVPSFSYLNPTPYTRTPKLQTPNPKPCPRIARAPRRSSPPPLVAWRMRMPRRKKRLGRQSLLFPPLFRVQGSGFRVQGLGLRV